MNNPWDEMRSALQQSKEIMSAADSVATSMANILVDRLRQVSPHALLRIKRELQKFDANKKAWKS